IDFLLRFRPYGLHPLHRLIDPVLGIGLADAGTRSNLCREPVSVSVGNFACRQQISQDAAYLPLVVADGLIGLRRRCLSIRSQQR
ncbi:hypothetical protein, partial [Escherichia coli]|uniref:hypothetical protein n=1 Tax=Escherichia coli TaxID=562 RepID=UPI0019647915